MSRQTKRQHIVAICYDKRGRPLSIGRNSYVKTHPLQAKYAAQVGEPGKVFLHAEVDAIIKVKDWSKIHSMTVVRLNSKGEEMNAKPCAVCQRIIELVGIPAVSHT